MQRDDVECYRIDFGNGFVSGGRDLHDIGHGHIFSQHRGLTKGLGEGHGQNIPWSFWHIEKHDARLERVLVRSCRS